MSSLPHAFLSRTWQYMASFQLQMCQHLVVAQISHHTLNSLQGVTSSRGPLDSISAGHATAIRAMQALPSHRLLLLHHSSDKNGPTWWCALQCCCIKSVTRVCLCPSVYEEPRSEKVLKFRTAGFRTRGAVIVLPDSSLFRRQRKQHQEEGKSVPEATIADMRGMDWHPPAAA